MKSILFLICFLFAALHTQPVFSQHWERINKEFETLQGAKKYKEALLVAKKAIEVAEKQFTIDSNEYHKSLQNLAQSYQTLEQWDKSLEYYKEVMRREISRVAKLDVSMSATIQSIIRLYDFLYDKKSATIVYQQATERLSLVKKNDTAVYAELSDYYTRVVMTQAPPTVAQALDMSSRITGVDQPALAEYANKYPETDAQSASSGQSPSTITEQENESLEDLLDRCTQHKAYSNFLGGIESCKKLYDRRRELQQQDSIAYARTCYDLGYLYMWSTQYSGAIQYYKEGIDIWEKNTFGKNGAYVEALYNISLSLQAMQKYDNIESLLLKAEKAVVGLGTDTDSLYPGILALRAAVQRMNGNYGTAEKTYDKSLVSQRLIKQFQLDNVRCFLVFVS